MVHEAARSIPVVDEVDLAVIGGSCTGVFAAIRAARFGLRVAIIEALNQFGGTAIGRMVYVWHSLWDFAGRRQIIGGLTQEVMDRLARRDAVRTNDGRDPTWQFRLNPAELACELDALVAEHPTIQPYLHT